jgi:simple sugar transport system ATP-binding protein
VNRAAEALLRERLNVRLDVTKPLGSYSIAIQQLVAIARALNISSRLLILDEPTSSLDRDEVGKLFDVMRHLKAQGLAILFVTHFLDQVYEIADRITILRNGRFVGEYRTEELPRMELVRKMIGRELEQLGDMPKTENRSGSADVSLAAGGETGAPRRHRAVRSGHRQRGNRRVGRPARLGPDGNGAPLVRRRPRR